MEEGRFSGRVLLLSHINCTNTSENSLNDIKKKHKQEQLDLPLERLSAKHLHVHYIINTIKSQDIILMRYQHEQVSGHYTYASSTRSSLRTLYVCVINTIKSQDIILMRHQHDQVSGHYTYALVRILMYKYNHFRCTVVVFLSR